MPDDKCWKCGDSVERTNTTLPGCDNDLFHNMQPPSMPSNAPPPDDKGPLDDLLNEADELEAGRIEAMELPPLSDEQPVREMDADGYAMLTHDEIIAMGGIIAIGAANEFAVKTAPAMVKIIRILKTATERVINSLGPDKIGCSANECKGCVCEMEYALEEAKNAIAQANEIAKGQVS